jgi:hypothetical protein
MPIGARVIGSLVALKHNKSLRFGLAERQLAELVENHEVHVRHAIGEP